MKQFIDYSLREFIGGSSTEQQINLSKFARARLTKFLKNKKYENLVKLSKSHKKPKNYMKLICEMTKDWDKQEEPYRKQEIRLLMGNQ